MFLAEMEEALYEVASIRQFAGLSLTRPIPDETTILNFRRLLETNELAPAIPGQINKRQFDFMKVRFKWLAKNTAHVVTLFALANSVDGTKETAADDGPVESVIQK